MKKLITFVLCASILFAACTPTQTQLLPSPQTQKSGIKGAVSLGPTCPVERIPPDPHCATKAYQTQLVLTNDDQHQIVQQFSSDASGNFILAVPAGRYTISPVSGSKTLPRCSSQSVTVKQDSYTNIMISCDTGMR